MEFYWTKALWSTDKLKETKLVIDHNNNLYVAIPGAVYRFDGIKWNVVGTVNFQGKDHFMDDQSIAFDSHNMPYVLYRDYSFENSVYKGGLTARKFDGTNWIIVGKQLFANEYSYCPTLAIDKHDIPYILFIDYNQGNKLSLMEFDGSSWIKTNTNVLTDAADIGSTLDHWKYPLLSFDSSNAIYVLYQTHNVIKVYKNASTTLPVSLLSFTGKNSGKANVLTWATSEEINASHFEVEKSPTGQSFVQIGTVVSRRQPSATYSFTDVVPSYPLSFYRLKIVDQDGGFKYSNVLTIGLSQSGRQLVYPMPALNYVYIKDAENYEHIEIVDISGRIVKEYAHQHTNTISLLNITPGMYFVRLTNKDSTQTIKILKQ